MQSDARQSAQVGTFEGLKRDARLGKASGALIPAVAKSLLCFVKHPLRFWYALRIAFRSFRGHIQELLSKKRWAVDLGPFYQLLPDGSCRENSRTHSRRLGTAHIKQSHPWANTVDLDLFLRGFDWGERYALGNICTRGIRSNPNGIPGGSRTRFRDDSEQHSGLKANRVPAGSRTVVRRSRNGVRFGLECFPQKGKAALDIKRGSLILFETRRFRFASKEIVRAEDQRGPEIAI